jgi:hypothetical protein
MSSVSQINTYFRVIDGDLLPNSEIHPLDTGHFAWEQAADEYGRLVADWVSGGYRRVNGAA